MDIWDKLVRAMVPLTWEQRQRFVLACLLIAVCLMAADLAKVRREVAMLEWCWRMPTQGGMK